MLCSVRVILNDSQCTLNIGRARVSLIQILNHSRRLKIDTYIMVNIILRNKKVLSDHDSDRAQSKRTRDRFRMGSHQSAGAVKVSAPATAPAPIAVNIESKKDLSSVASDAKTESKQGGSDNALDLVRASSSFPCSLDVLTVSLLLDLGSRR